MKQQSPFFRCDGINRRDFLHAGLMTGLGLNMADLMRSRALASESKEPKPAKAKSCILIWLDGGPSHLETFDLKPDAPVEIRGEFKPIKTDVPGIEISEHLPRTARVMKHVALVRSLTHAFGNHNTGSHYLLTGNKPSPVIEYPSMGSIYAQQAGAGKVLPPYVAVPEGVTYSGSGFLPATYQPFSLGGDPSKPDFRVRNLNPPASLSFERVERRREMQQFLDEVKRSTEERPIHTPVDTYYEQAYALLTSPESQAAFDLSKEPSKVREHYGRSRVGTGCLMARRMVEHGVGFVTVVDKGWDMHQQIFKNMPDAMFRGSGKLPALDQAYSGLIADLAERGLLDSTLVMLMGEFGRTPKINDRAGRDHWPRAGFVCLAGGGVRGGQVIGSTDAFGESPNEQPVAPEDLAASTLSLMGIQPDDAYQAPNGRPIQWVKGGSIIKGLS
ncbi:DUF1501 domain-containing protein [Verrucomicrobia bacterium]|nr:DUF1501 domain-containing protein [bacterium]MDB4642304.1 DUF1501 domain-containing protein [Verrucomicrobiota bacterium]MDB4689330.1 DUF1501 domain-containing protein [Verrucomicrobiota bacterium]MDB4717547.1 DUF1501 domain-containing protein [Verrucomicrobiota bacterium]